jgi:hypothetical protein
MAFDTPRKQKIRTYLAQEGFGSVCNFTKWAKAVDLIKERSISVDVKFLQDDQVVRNNWISMPVSTYLEGSGFGPMGLLEVEWIECQNVGELREALVRSGLHVKEVDGRIRVYGHVKVQ